MRSPAVLLVLALLAACQCPPDVERFDADSCRGRLNAKYVELRWRAGSERHVFDGPDGRLGLDVLRVTNLLTQHQVEVEIAFTNGYDRELRFDVAGVTLAWDGDEFPCSRSSARSPAVRPGRPTRVAFTFPIDTQGRAGVHEFAIDGAHFKGDESDTLPGGALVLPVKIPGRVGPQDDWNDDARWDRASSRDTGGDDWRDDR